MVLFPVNPTETIRLGFYQKNHHSRFMDSTKTWRGSMTGSHRCDLAEDHRRRSDVSHVQCLVFAGARRLAKGSISEPDWLWYDAARKDSNWADWAKTSPVESFDPLTAVAGTHQQHPTVSNSALSFTLTDTRVRSLELAWHQFWLVSFIFDCVPHPRVFVKWFLHVWNLEDKESIDGSSPLKLESEELKCFSFRWYSINRWIKSF